MVRPRVAERAWLCRANETGAVGFCFVCLLKGFCFGAVVGICVLVLSVKGLEGLDRGLWDFARLQ